jgi:hypothetical protein
VRNVEAVEAWYQAQDAYYRASDAYNARLEIVKAERERGNWTTMNAHLEYRALNDAQRDALAASATFYRFLREQRNDER